VADLVALARAETTGGADSESGGGIGGGGGGGGGSGSGGGSSGCGGGSNSSGGGGGTGIVYARLRAECEKLAEQLSDAGLEVEVYHAGWGHAAFPRFVINPNLVSHSLRYMASHDIPSNIRQAHCPSRHTHAL
jgi:hypothetical protein